MSLYIRIFLISIWKEEISEAGKCKVTQTFIGGLLNGGKQKNSLAAEKMM